jgi:hypothetical protein
MVKLFGNKVQIDLSTCHGCLSYECFATLRKLIASKECKGHWVMVDSVTYHIAPLSQVAK